MLAGVGPEGPRRSGAPWRRIVTTVVAILALGLISVGITSSNAQLTATIKNTTDTAGSRAFFTCRTAEKTTTGVWGAWALGTSITLLTTPETDFSGNGRNGTWSVLATALNNNYGCQRDSPQASVTFNGLTTCMVPAKGSAAVAFARNNFSEEAWVSIPTGTNGPIFDFTDSASDISATYWDRMLYVNTSGQLVFGNFDTGIHVVTSPLTYRDNTWHHVVAVNSTTGIYLYVDGVQVASSGPITAYPTTGWWHVGCGRLGTWPGAGSERFTGQIQYAAIYTVPLTADQVMMHYLAGRV